MLFYYFFYVFRARKANDVIHAKIPRAKSPTRTRMDSHRVVPSRRRPSKRSSSIVSCAPDSKYELQIFLIVFCKIHRNCARHRHHISWRSIVHLVRSVTADVRQEQIVAASRSLQVPSRTPHKYKHNTKAPQNNKHE